MIKTGTILRKLRKNRNMSQADLCKGIITRQTYSKIENNLQEPNFEILNAILQKLDYEISDFSKELNATGDYDEYYKLFLRGLQGELTIIEAKKLFEYAEINRVNNNKCFHFYGIVKGHLHHKYPSAIPNYTNEDKTLFKLLINKCKFFYSIYDLKMIGDFATHFLKYDELIILKNKLPDFTPYNYGEDSEVYRNQIHKIYNNFCDMAIFNDDLATAKDLLEKHKKFSEVHPLLKYLMYIKVNETTIKYMECGNIEVLIPLTDLVKTLKAIGDDNTARVIQYQYDTLKSNTEYNSTNSIAYD